VDQGGRGGGGCPAPGKPADRIAIGTSYECRNQNRQASGKLSEHAFANGVDISGFEFKGRKALQIGEHPAGTPDALFQAAIRTQACAYFTTVLGPGSDPAHATHLHLDLRSRGRGFPAMPIIEDLPRSG
jgi:hypothetical protein